MLFDDQDGAICCMDGLKQVETTTKKADTVQEKIEKNIVNNISLWFSIHRQRPYLSLLYFLEMHWRERNRRIMVWAQNDWYTRFTTVIHSQYHLQDD